MIRSKIQKYEMLTRVADFAAANVSLFPKNTAAAQLAKDIHAAVDTLAETKASPVAAQDQMVSSRKQRLARQQALRSQVEAIRQTADALHAEGFPLPGKPGASALFDAARNYADAVGALKPSFVLHGLPANFIENLKSAAAQLQAAINAQDAARTRRKTAIEEFDKTLEEALGYLQRFEALLSNTMSDNRPVMAAWEVAHRVERARNPRKIASDHESPAPPNSAVLVSPAA